MSESLRLSELRGMAPVDRESRIARLAAALNRPLNGELTHLNERIAAYEAHYEISSEHMRELFDAQKYPEHADICDWLMLLKLRERLVSSSKT